MLTDRLETQTSGPKAKPNTKSESERVVTSVLTPNSVDKAAKVGEKEDDAKVAPMVVKPRRMVMNIFFLLGHYKISW